MFHREARVGQTLRIPINTYNSSGASVTATNLAAADVEIYKDGSTTQRASDNGITVTVDFDSVTGIHMIAIDLNDNSDSGFYAIGSEYFVKLGPFTVDSQTVELALCTFRIIAAEHSAGYPVATIKDGTGTGEIDTTSGGVLVAAIANNAITTASINDGALTAAKFAADFLTAAKIASDVGTEIAAAVWDRLTSALSTANSIGKLLVDNINATISSRASQTSVDTIDDFLDTEIAAILADTNELQTDWANGGRLDNILDARASQTSVDTIDDFLDTEVAAIKVVTDKLDDTLEDDGGTYRFTANALEESPAGGGAPTAEEIADAVWEEALGDHSATSGSTAEALAAAGGAGDPWITPLPGSYSSGQAGYIVGNMLDAAISTRASQSSLDTLDNFVDTEVAAILADTDELQQDWANGGRLDLLIDAIKAKTDNLPSDPADASDVAASFSTVNSTLATIAGYIDTEVAAILAAVDTEVAAIKAKTDNLPASPAATGDIPSAGTIADAVHDEVVEGTVTLRQSIRLHNAALGGKASGLDTASPKYRNLADSKDVIDAVTDADGNRSAVTLDLTA